MRFLESFQEYSIVNKQKIRKYQSHTKDSRKTLITNAEMLLGFYYEMKYDIL